MKPLRFKTKLELGKPVKVSLEMGGRGLGGSDGGTLLGFTSPGLGGSSPKSSFA